MPIGVGEWLERIGLERYERTFVDNDIDAEVLPDLSEADLEKLGVSLGHRKKLLKAISALWQVLIDQRVRATFKIDLDQIFPQERLVEEGGGSAFEHFQSPLWGAQGFDVAGNAVELGMLATNSQGPRRNRASPLKKSLICGPLRR